MEISLVTGIFFFLVLIALLNVVAKHMYGLKKTQFIYLH